MGISTRSFSSETVQRSDYVGMGLEAYPASEVFIFWNSAASEVSFELFMVDDETGVCDYAFYLKINDIKIHLPFPSHLARFSSVLDRGERPCLFRVLSVLVVFAAMCWP